MNSSLRGLARASAIGIATVLSCVSMTQVQAFPRLPTHPQVVKLIELTTFWGRPYPYGYVYDRPNAGCWRQRHVETPSGPRIKPVWICGPKVTTKY